MFSKKPEIFKILGGFKKQIFESSQQLQRETKAGNKNLDDKKICHKRKRDDLSDNEKNSDSVTQINRFTFKNKKNGIIIWLDTISHLLYFLNSVKLLTFDVSKRKV